MGLVGWFCALMLIGVGILSLVNPDLMWSLRKWENDRAGVVSERTGTWENSNSFSGWVAIMLGLFMIALILVAKW